MAYWKNITDVTQGPLPLKEMERWISVEILTAKDMTASKTIIAKSGTSLLDVLTINPLQPIQMQGQRYLAVNGGSIKMSANVKADMSVAGMKG